MASCIACTPKAATYPARENWVAAVGEQSKLGQSAQLRCLEPGCSALRTQCDGGSHWHCNPPTLVSARVYSLASVRSLVCIRDSRGVCSKPETSWPQGPLKAAQQCSSTTCISVRPTSHTYCFLTLVFTDLAAKQDAGRSIAVCIVACTSLQQVSAALRAAADKYVRAFVLKQ